MGPWPFFFSNLAFYGKDPLNPSMNASNSEETVFGAALRLAPAERANYLDQACGGDAALRQRVEGLLNAYQQAENFLETPAAPTLPLARTAWVPLAEKAGDKIGRYKLLQQIGEGGCGVVYMAEQEEPVRRRVALKVIKLGMDTKQVIARFEAERQALAMMDHPNIAKVFDAGATETGRPYFVMELVRGVKITDYCDEKKLPIRQRLDLFIQVCQAIQHAHQKGVIHRDIKPSNILVTVNDGVPVPKVIDFGIAKATGGQRLTDKTVFTAFEQFIGTPAYMSPEQAVITSLDIDTRSDIYALGVLLYELLTGQTPFDSKQLLAVGLDEMRRTIREQEPERPSTRLSTLADDKLSTTAQRRGLDSPKFISELRGDLDCVVMKALEKDRARRYETANGLAMDIQHHLNNEPVVARPPSNLYRFQKLVRRNKLAFAAATAVAAALLIGFGVSTWMFFRERAARREQVRLREFAEANEKKARLEATRSRRLTGLLKDTLRDFMRHEGFYFASTEEALVAASDHIETELQAPEMAGEFENDLKADFEINLGALSLRRRLEGLMEVHNYAEVDKVLQDVSVQESASQARNAPVLQVRATFQARRGRFREAARDISKLIEIDRKDFTYYYVLAPLSAANGDLPGYRQLCKEMLARFGGTKDPSVAERAAKACSIVPPLESDLNRIAQLAELAVTGKEVGDNNLPWWQFAEGLVEYRRKHYESAAGWMQKALIPIPFRYSVDNYRFCPAYMVLAMTNYRLGQVDSARAAFAKGVELSERTLPDFGSEDLGVHWYDVLIAHTLMLEAKGLLEEKTAAQTETLLQHALMLEAKGLLQGKAEKTAETK
ncbi:MAG: serine/threonine-protein kinase [Verrucomicrobiota bacterium]